MLFIENNLPIGLSRKGDTTPREEFCLV